MITVTGYENIQPIHLGERSLLFRATEKASNSPVILKTHAQKRPSATTIRQYQQEFALGQLIKHNNVILYKTIRSTPDNIVLVLEDCNARVLSEFIAEAPFDLDRFFTVAEQLLNGVQAIHAQNIVHTALNPQNILLNAETETIIIIDFSEATQLILPPPPLLAAHVAEANPYCAPEQVGLRDAQIDHRADIYALGVIFYELLTGTVADLVAKDMTHVAPPHLVDATIPEMVSTWVMSFLHGNIDKRYQSCTLALTDLLKCKTAWLENGRIPNFPLTIQDDIIERHPDEQALMRVLATSQALSGEVNLQQLLTKLMQIIVDDTDANISHLILQSNENLRIAASVESIDQGVHISQPMSIPQDDQLAKSLVLEALQTGQLVYFHGSQGNGYNPVHAQDFYVQQLPKISVLCVPIRYKDKTTGVLYLENNKDASFSNKQIEILQFLATQTAISLENAFLYEDLSQALIQHKRTEKKLKSLDQRLKIAMETGTLGIWDWDVKQNKITWSDHVEKLFGMETGEFDGTYETYLSLIHPDDIVELEQKIANALSSPDYPYHVTHRLIWPNGEVHWLEATGKVYRDDQGEPIHMTGHVMDITERKKREIADREREAWLERVLELGKTITAVTDWDQCWQTLHYCVQKGLEFERVGTFIYNPLTQIVQGVYGTDSTGEKEDTSWFVKDVRKDPGFEKVIKSPKGFLFYENLHESIEREEHHEMYGVGQHATVAVWSGDDPIGAIAVDNGITHTPIKAAQLEALRLFASYAGFALENARLLDQLYQQKDQLQLALNAAQMGTWNWDMKPGGVSWTKQVALLHGFPEEQHNQIDNRDLWSKIHPTDKQKLHKTVNKLQDVDETAFRTDYRIPLESGNVRWLEVTGKRVNDDTGNPIRISGTIIDITARKQAEIEKEQLIEELEARNAELERFTYTVSHDLKSPLITIRGFLGLLERDIERNDQAKVARDMERIHAAAGRMLLLLDDLLELSRIGRLTNPPTAVSINELATEAIELVTGRIEQQHVNVIVQPNCPTVYVDKPRLVEVFQNLIDNAVKFMGDQPDPTIEIGAYKNEDETEIVCFVKDNGIGIETRYLERIFNLFERLDPSIDGTGIGLALIKRIIEFHNGRIWAESEELGQGTTFIFTLPPVTSSNSIYE